MPLRHVVQQADHRNRRIRQLIRPNASVRMPALSSVKETPQGERRKHKVLTPEKLQTLLFSNVTSLIWKYWTLELFKMVEVKKEDDELTSGYFSKTRKSFAVMIVIRSTEDSERRHTRPPQGEFNIKDIHKIIKRRL